MPIYEYQCQACGEHAEFIQKINDAPKMQCPHCNANTLRRLISAASFHLKGSGWYETDFKNKSNKKAETKEESTTKESTVNKTTKTKKQDNN